MERWVVVPLLIRTVIPNITTEFLTVFKGSSLAMAVGVMETTYMMQCTGRCDAARWKGERIIFPWPSPNPRPAD